MPNLASVETVDTVSTDGTCIYNPAPIGGTPVPTTVMVSGPEGPEVLKIISGAPVPYACADVVGVKINPLSPLPCQPGTRILRPTVNTTVFINGQLPAVTGDEAQLIIGGTPRPLTGPFQHPTIVIGSNLEK